MNRRIVFGFLLAVVLTAGAASIGVYAYNAGVARGLAASEALRVAPPEAGGLPYPYYGGPFFFRPPFGFGFGFLGCLLPLLFFFVFFGLLRGFRGAWHGPWGWGHPGHWGKGAPPLFEEWHRQAHGQGAGPAQEPPSTET